MTQTALTIQKSYRMHKAQVTLHRKRALLHKSCTVIQSVFRSAEISKSVFQFKINANNAACLIQRVTRGFLDRKFVVNREAWHLRLAQTTSRFIKSFLRQVESRESQYRRRISTITIQGQYRLYLLRCEHRRIVRACTLIQALFRGHRVRKQYRPVQAFLSRLPLIHESIKKLDEVCLAS